MSRGRIIPRESHFSLLLTHPGGPFLRTAKDPPREPLRRAGVSVADHLAQLPSDGVRAIPQTALGKEPGFATGADPLRKEGCWRGYPKPSACSLNQERQGHRLAPRSSVTPVVVPGCPTAGDRFLGEPVQVGLVALFQEFKSFSTCLPVRSSLPRHPPAYTAPETASAWPVLVGQDPEAGLLRLLQTAPRSVRLPWALPWPCPRLLHGAGRGSPLPHAPARSGAVRYLRSAWVLVSPPSLERRWNNSFWASSPSK